MTGSRAMMEDDREQRLAQQYRVVRARSESHCKPLETEDFGLQACPETSPAKWHLAHTSWFFETFLLRPFLDDYRPLNDQYQYLFNSYYNGIGEQYPRASRGLLSRPTVAEIFRYREHIDRAILRLLEQDQHVAREDIERRLILGLHHEQQHQELFFTDLKYNFAQNPLWPVYLPAPQTPDAIRPTCPEPGWQRFDAGITMIGSDNKAFCFDNETPRHRVWLDTFEIATRPVSNADWLAFMRDGGYQRPELWLADGWAVVTQEQWHKPLYWVGPEPGDDIGHASIWREFTLYGLRPLDPAASVCHLSGYEADAYARWAGARLPSEAEWEHAATTVPIEGHFLDSGLLQPGAAGSGLSQMFGSVWEWTSSAYGPYPGFQAAEGAIGEYNGKFMCNQLVLRGGSCVSERSHLRPGYRNFFYPRDRWQFSGLRLARTVR